MAASVLEAARRDALPQPAGANLDSGIASALLAARAGQVGLFEVDEAALTGVCDALRPTTLVLGNLFRDQLDRYGELELIGERWRGLVAGLGAAGTAVAYNADDPLVAGVGAQRRDRVRLRHRGHVGRPRVDAARRRLQVVRPLRHRLGYDAVFLGHLGHWRCPNCGNARPAPAVVARAVRTIGLEASEFTLETARRVGRRAAAGRRPLQRLQRAGRGRRSGRPTAYRRPTVAEGLGRFSAAFGRGERIDLDGRPALVLLIKNPAGANEVIRTLAAEPGPQDAGRRAERPDRRRPRRVVDLGRRLRGAGAAGRRASS